mgnify:CR=1 FL=1
MQNRHISFTPKNIVMYLSGFFITALGVIFMLRGNFGAGAWDTVTANLNAFFHSVNFPISVGLTSMSIALTIFAFVILYTKKWQLIGMLIPIGIMGTVLDFWDIIIFGDYVAELLSIRILFSLLGAFLIPLGLATIVSSHFPAFVFDELTIVVMDIFKSKSITKARLGIEFLGISMGILFGFMAGIGFGAVNVGSIVMAIILPPMFNYFVKKLGAFDE